MNAEKFVKKEAKETLSGNWVVAVLAVMVLCFIPMIAMLIVDIAYSLAYDVNDSVIEAVKSSPELAVFFIVFHLLAVVSVILLSPLMNGFVRIYCSLAEKKTVSIADLFYFFDSKEKYVKSVKFMTNLIVRAVLIIAVCLIPALAIYLAVGDNDALFPITVILAVVGLIAAFVMLHRYVYANMLFSYYECGVKESLDVGGKIAKHGVLPLVKLSLTFIPWLLLTFFVVPFLYVYPYMTCSYFVSAKYLYQQYIQATGNTSFAERTTADADSFNTPVQDGQGTAEINSHIESNQENHGNSGESESTEEADLNVATESNEPTFSTAVQVAVVTAESDEGGKVTGDL